VRLVKRLHDRRRDPAPLADAVAVLASPLSHRSGLLTGLPTATTSGAASTAAGALDLPGALNEPTDSGLELRDILRGQVDLVGDSIDSERESPLGWRTVNVIDEFTGNFLRHAPSS